MTSLSSGLSAMGGGMALAPFYNDLTPSIMTKIAPVLSPDVFSPCLFTLPVQTVSRFAERSSPHSSARVNDQCL